MKTNRQFLNIFILIILIYPVNLNAQSKIIADNSFYTSFDLIHYAFYRVQQAPTYYALELNDTYGRPWIEQKIKSDSGFFYGVLTLKTNIPSGIYWLHAYPAVFSRELEPQFYLPLFIINADDLDGDRWKNFILKSADSICILPVLPAINNSSTKMYIAINHENQILPCTGKLKNNSNHIIIPVKSENNGFITLSGLDESSMGFDLSISVNQEDTVTIKMLKNFVFNDSNDYLQYTCEEEPGSSTVKFNISSDKSIYDARDSVTLWINVSGVTASTTLNSRIIVEAREVQSSGINFDTPNKYILKRPGENAIVNKEILENNNISGRYVIHGSFKNLANGHPMTYHNVALICLGKNPEFSVASVDQDGKFSFDVSNLPENNSVFISTIDEPIKGLAIKDSYFRNFTDRPVLFFDCLNIAALDSFVSMAKIRDVINYQYFEKHYGKPVISEELLYDSAQVYSQADISYDLNDYVHFDNIPEVIREILPYVNLKNLNNNPRITIYNSTNPGLNRNPLFLINGLPTHNIGIILNLSTRDVQKIDLLYGRNTIKPFGLIGLGGIMAIYTTLPPEIPYSELLEFTGLHKPSPVYLTQAQKNAPDLSPLIYWNAAAYLKDGNCRVKFRLNDLLSDILINVTGYGKDGKIIKASAILKVNKIIRY